MATTYTITFDILISALQNESFLTFLLHDSKSILKKKLQSSFYEIGITTKVKTLLENCIQVYNLMKICNIS